MFRITGTVALIAILLFLYVKQTPAVHDRITPIGDVAVVIDVGESGKSNVNFTWQHADGNTASLSDHLGKVVLINFWATWCVPCRKEIPELIEINNELSDDLFTVIGISVDGASDIEKVDMFIKNGNIDYLNILDDGRLTRQFGNIRAIPTTLIIDKEGTVRETIVGVRTKDQFMEKIQQYL
jgi:thiol-disulfide isomerase/thioredoxin